MANKNIFGQIKHSTRKKFRDTFDRTNDSTLGTATDGSLWTTIRSAFSISGNKAAASTSDYPISAINFPQQNVKIELTDVTQGSSAALWVTGSGDWWAVGIDRPAVNCNCVNNYACNGGWCGGNCIPGNFVCSFNVSNSDSGCAFNCSAKNAATCNSYAIMGYNTSTCKGYNASNCKSFYKSYCSGGYNTSNCTGYNGSNPYYSPQSWNNCTGFVAGNCIYYNYFCNSYGYTYCGGGYYNCIGYNATYCCTALTVTGQTCQTCYPQYIRVMKSVGSVISEVTSWAMSTIIGSFRVKTTGNQVTIEAYSDTNLVSLVDGALTYTATGATLSSMYGISVKPSTYDQGSTIGGITIDKN